MKLNKLTSEELEIILKADQIIQETIKKYEVVISEPIEAVNLFTYKIAEANSKGIECFFVAYLNNKNCVISVETSSTGSINKASVYPREVTKAALAHNASSVIFAHNHPSGNCEPSPSDIKITEHLKEALSIFDITVLDHFIMAGDAHYSFAIHGLL